MFEVDDIVEITDPESTAYGKLAVVTYDEYMRRKGGVSVALTEYVKLHNGEWTNTFCVPHEDLHFLRLISKPQDRS